MCNLRLGREEAAGRSAAALRGMGGQAMKAKWKIARSLLVVVLSVLLAASTILALVHNIPFRASAEVNFTDIIQSEELTLEENPKNRAVPDTMDNTTKQWMERVFNLGFAEKTKPYTISSLSEGYENAAFASVQGTKYAEGADDEKAFYISSDMVTNTKANELFSSAGTTLSFSTAEDSQGGYVVFDFKIGGELLDAGLDSDLLFGLLGKSGEDFGLPYSGDVTGHFNTAQLFYKVGAITDEEMNDALSSSAAIGLAASGSGKTSIYIAGDSLDDYSKKESAATLHRAAWITDGNDVATSSAVVQKEDGWYQARIPVGAGKQSVSLGLTFGTTNLFSACVDTFFAMAYEQDEHGVYLLPAEQRVGNVQNSGIDSYFVIRNVDFKGNTETPDEISVTVEGAEGADGLVTAQIGNSGEQTGAAAGFTLTQGEEPFVGKKVHLKLDPSKLNGKTFYGWDVGGQFYGGTEVDAEIMQDVTAIKAICGEATAYEARIGTTFYQKFDEALAAANIEGGVVTVTVPRGRTLDLTNAANRQIRKGVTVVLPYDASGRGYASGVAEGKATQSDLAPGLAWQDEGKYRNMTVEFGGDWEIQGTLTVGGVLNAPDSGAQSRTSGNYAELKNNGTLNVSGTVNVYGRITGSGSINIEKGGALAEPFLILDFTTGENAADAVLSGLLDRINGHTATTPFLRYALANVENEMNIAYGGRLNGFLSLYALGRTVSFDQPIVGTKDDNCFMMLQEGASVQISYENKAVSTKEGNCTEGIGKTVMNFEGGADIGALNFTVFGVTFDSQGFVFSIPYHFDITLGGSGANYEFATEFMVMPGSTLTLGEGATLNITHTFWTLEGYQADPIPYENAADGEGKYYPSADELAAAGYSKSGNFIVNGTLNVGTNGEEIAFLGIVQTTGSTGKMTIGDNVDTGAQVDDQYEDYKVEWNGGGTVDDWVGYQHYPTAAGQFDAGRFIFTGKVRQARDALAAAQPQVEYGTTDEEAAAKARSIRFFVLCSPARAGTGFGWSENLEAGHSYTAKRDTEWTLQSYQYFNSLLNQDEVSELKFEEYEIDQTMHGGWRIDHDHTEGEEPDVYAYVAQWNRGFYPNEYTFADNEPCKPVARYHNLFGCEEKPDTKLLVNPN